MLDRAAACCAGETFDVLGQRRSQSSVRRQRSMGDVGIGGILAVSGGAGTGRGANQSLRARLALTDPRPDLSSRDI